MRIYQSSMQLREKWESWFAWHPVQVEMADGRHAWVIAETVERKEIIGYGGAQWRYRERLVARQQVDDLPNLHKNSVDEIEILHKDSRKQAAPHPEG